MKLTLVNIWKERYPNLGLGYLASYLNKYYSKCEIEIVDNNNNIQDAFDEIIKSNPDIIGFSAFTSNYYKIEEIAKKLKSVSKVPIILGGPHITPIPHTLNRCFDIAVLGEGEETLLELVKLFNKEGKKFTPNKLKRIGGISFRYKNKIVITPPRRLIKSLDIIPPPARYLFDMESYLKPQNILCNNKLIKGTSILTSRGCPYHCIYCQASAMWGKIRLHSAEYVVKEIKMLYKKYNIEGICIVDDLFISDIRRVKKIVEGLKNEKLLGKIQYLVDGRANLINDEILEILKEMGTVQIAIGFESASEKIIKYLKKGSVTLEQNYKAVETIRKHNIDIYAQFMIGTPGETEEDLLKTFNFIKDNQLTHSHVSITTPLPGTELWEYCKKAGIVDEFNVNWGKFNMQPSMNLIEHFYINKRISYKKFNRWFNKFNEYLTVMRIGEKTKLDLINYQNLIYILKYIMQKPKSFLRIFYRLILEKTRGYKIK